MLLRSQSQACLANLGIPGDSNLSVAPSQVLPQRPTLDEVFLDCDDNQKHQLISEMFEKRYKCQARPLQITSVLSLSKQRTTFLLAATGFGNSRIVEMFYHLYLPKSKPIILIINPLEALGDNQVSYFGIP